MNAKTLAAVTKHGEDIKRIFGMAEAVDPVGLCRKLRRLERDGQYIGLRMCNGPEFTEDESDKLCADVMAKLDKLLCYAKKGIPCLLNLDPRGYALKIDDSWVREHKDAWGLHRDFGGYGIIAPDLTTK